MGSDSDSNWARCGDVRREKAFRINPNRSAFEPMAIVWDIELRCTEYKGHMGPHSCLLPKEAGDDAFKKFSWPNK